MKSILLTGYKGYLGSFLYDYLSRGGYDIQTVPASKPYDVIINCAAKSTFEYCEEHPEESRKSNVDLIKNLISFHKPSYFIHFSSYYVYDSSGFCTESSRTTDKYQYMSQKLESEKIVLENNGLVVRVGKLFGLNTMVGFLKKRLTEHLITTNQPVTVDRVRFNPTDIKSLARFISICMNEGIKGLYNFSNYGTPTHEEYAKFIFDILSKTEDIIVVDKIFKPFHNYGKFVMDTSKSRSVYSPEGWQSAVSKYLERL